MAGGWFFLTVAEAFTLGNRDFRLPGIGAYTAAAIDAGDFGAMGAAVVAMVVMIVATDQLVWRPALAWAQKFKLEGTGRAEVARPAVPALLRRSPGLESLRAMVRRAASALRGSQPVAAGGASIAGSWLQRFAAVLTVALAASLTAWGAIDLVHML